MLNKSDAAECAGFNAKHWQARLDTGIRSVDRQHLELLEWMAQFEATHVTGNNAQALDDILPQLEVYALFHFSEEEKLMGTLAGEDALRRSHVAQHHAFIDQIKVLTSARASAGDQEVAENLTKFLRQWLVEHIATADVMLCQKLLKQRPSPAGY